MGPLPPTVVALSSVSSANGSSLILLRFPPFGAGPPKFRPVSGDCCCCGYVKGAPNAFHVDCGCACTGFWGGCWDREAKKSSSFLFADEAIDGKSASQPEEVVAAFAGFPKEANGSPACI
jgi:hypothetical protein